MRIALVGNPNCGKTTLFNELTGSSQYVGNWPGVTVEKKEGKYKKDKTMHLVDLPGVYSLAPYSLEEVITRDFLIDGKPDVIINIIDAVNLERNLYLTTQVLEMNIPTVVALNRVDMVDSENVKIDMEALAKRLGVPVVRTVATRGRGIHELMDLAKKQADKKIEVHKNFFSDELKSLLKDIEKDLEESGLDNLSYHAIKVFEDDKHSFEKYNYDKYLSPGIKEKIKNYQDSLDDDGESIVISEKYEAIADMLDGIYKKETVKELSTSDKIDKVITNKWLGLPIFFLIMWFVYYISINTVGDWTVEWVEGAVEWLHDSVMGALENAGASEVVQGLIGDGIINAFGAIFTFVPQLMILFLFISILEDSGYMARVAFIMDRLFRRFGLSGKSFIPMLIGSGCSIPGVMATRTIENKKDRDMTILLTPFVPCGAKLPVFGAMIAMVFNDQTWVAPAIYLIAFLGIIISGIVLKKTKRFAGDPAPFVMELPPYTVPTLKNVWLHMWDRAKGFIKKAGSVIFVANLAIWLLMSFDFKFNYLGENIDQSILAKFGGVIRYLFIPLGFGDSWAIPVATATGLIAKEVVLSTFATIGSVQPIVFTQVSAFSFIIFTIFAAPCFAAIGAMKREFNDKSMTRFALLYQTGLAYVLAMLTNLFGNLIFKNTQATEKVVIDYEIVEEVGENAKVLPHDLFGYVALGFLAVSVLIILYNQFFKKKD